MAGLLPSLWGQSNNNSDTSLTSLQREIDRVFNEFHRGFGLPGAWQGGEGTFSPRFDVVESDASVEVTTELPGVAEADIDVTIVDDVLTIRGEKKAEKKEEKSDYRLVERSYGSFQRSLRLPFHADADKIEAHFKDGVLKVAVAKPPEVERKTQKVAIKSAS